MKKKVNRLLASFARCEQKIHNKYGNDPEELAKGAPPPWSQKQWDWFIQRVDLFAKEADWATPEEIKTLRYWLGTSAKELNSKDPVVRACVEGLVYTVNIFLKSKGHN
jgi:hypothetical protein